MQMSRPIPQWRWGRDVTDSWNSPMSPQRPAHRMTSQCRQTDRQRHTHTHLSDVELEGLVHEDGQTGNQDVEAPIEAELTRVQRVDRN